VDNPITNFDVFRVTPEAYGAKYHDHVMDQYKLYVEMTDRMSARRAATNTFFLTVNTLLVSMLGVFLGTALATAAFREWWLMVFGVVGMLFCLAWWRLVSGYRYLSLGKFLVIKAIEVRLPLALYEMEEKILGGPDSTRQYRPLTNMETRIPFIFGFIYSLILISGVYNFFMAR
jgi:hypothetical protein